MSYKWLIDISNRLKQSNVHLYLIHVIQMIDWYLKQTETIKCSLIFNACHTNDWLISKPDWNNQMFDWYLIHRGSYMSAHVLLNLINELGKRDKMWSLPSILSLFRNEFDKFNNTRARMLRFYLSYDIKNTLKSHFSRKNVIILSFTQRCYGRHIVSRKSINH